MEYTPLFVYYYDGPFKKGNRRITSCLLVDDKGRVAARGLAFCSFLDQPNSKIGKRIAEGRAKNIVAKRKPPGKRHVLWPTNRPEIQLILDACGQDWRIHSLNDSPFLYKAEKEPMLLPPREQIVLDKFRSRNKAA